LLNIGAQHLSEAEGWIQKAIAADKRNGMMWHLAKDYAALARVSLRKENPSKAQKNLKEAIEIFKQCGADGWTKKYETDLQRAFD
jgi:hypothetical protein